MHSNPRILAPSPQTFQTDKHVNRNSVLVSDTLERWRLTAFGPKRDCYLPLFVANMVCSQAPTDSALHTHPTWYHLDIESTSHRTIHPSIQIVYLWIIPARSAGMTDFQHHG